MTWFISVYSNIQTKLSSWELLDKQIKTADGLAVAAWECLFTKPPDSLTDSKVFYLTSNKERYMFSSYQAASLQGPQKNDLKNTMKVWSRAFCKTRRVRYVWDQLLFNDRKMKNR